ncbi:Rho-GTPase-activating protein 8 [Sphaceloma murrayae]|uniref:Rho-GTPase-activating protein 8 n=1 Tax=Sphaceloma murrayae TaxID=2082308 RepID=A0A2K1QZV3_9PEZI|nr:Rho-GTPase-activating protein 8 [Sphaceloma murrayae]
MPSPRSLLLVALAAVTTTLSNPLPDPASAPCTSPCPAAAATTLIPTSAFSSKASLEKLFSYGYPWGMTHNGASRMVPENSVADGGTLTLTAKYTGPQSGKPNLKYNAGAVYAKSPIVMSKGCNIAFEATFVAPVAKGTWPAFWLTATKGWPPEIDIAEWKGNGKISYNTFNTSSQVTAKDVVYPNPGQPHKVRGVLRDLNGRDVQMKFFKDDREVTSQTGRGYVGQSMWLIINLQMEGSSGSPGPKTDTVYKISDLSVVKNS